MVSLRKVYIHTQTPKPIPNYPILCNFKLVDLRKVAQDSFLHSIKDAEVLHNLKVLSLTGEQLVGVLAGLHGVHHSRRVGHTHLLGHLAGSCKGISFQLSYKNFEKRSGRPRNNSPLSLPKIKPNTDCRPIKFRKYHDRLDTHFTSRSRVITPDWSIDLKRIVKGKGSLTSNAR